MRASERRRAERKVSAAENFSPNKPYIQRQSGAAFLFLYNRVALKESAAGLRKGMSWLFIIAKNISLGQREKEWRKKASARHRAQHNTQGVIFSAKGCIIISSVARAHSGSRSRVCNFQGEMHFGRVLVYAFNGRILQSGMDMWNNWEHLDVCLRFGAAYFFLCKAAHKNEKWQAEPNKKISQSKWFFFCLEQILEESRQSFCHRVRWKHMVTYMKDCSTPQIYPFSTQGVFIITTINMK